MRKNYTGNQKVKIVLEILKEEKTMTQIASENGIHPNQLSKWKNLLLERMPEILEDGRRKGDDEIATIRKQLEESYIEIGKLTTQMNWLKKKCGIKLEQG
jgi:transposase-like protein